MQSFMRKRAQYRPRPCETCGKTVFPLTSRMKFCSLKCRVSAYIDKSGGPAACWPWTKTTHKFGYGIVSLGKGKIANAHRLSWMMAHNVEVLKRTDFVCHTCDNPICCNPNHLYLGTQRTNVADMQTRGRRCKTPNMPKGEAQWNSKLTADDVAEIRLRKTERLSVLARKYGVTETTISGIRLMKSWKHVR